MKPLAVSDLASFVFRHGDLYPSDGERRVEAWEGAAAHSAMQKKRTNSDPKYQKELSLKVPVRLLDQDWRLQGRIDGLTYRDDGAPVVEDDDEPAPGVPPPPGGPRSARCRSISRSREVNRSR